MIETYNPNGGYQKLHMLQDSNFSCAMITDEPKQVPFLGSKKVADSHRAESELQSERVFRNQRDRDDRTGYMVNEKQVELWRVE
jgi:hypothetical protein